MMSKYSGGLNNSNKHLSNAIIATYINLKDNLSEKEISFIEKHLSMCQDCRIRLKEMIEEDIEIDDLRISELQNNRDPKFNKQQNKYYIWAAAAVLILATGIGLIYILQPGDTEIIVKDEKQEVDSLMTGGKIPRGEILQEEKTGYIEDKEYNQSDFAANVTLENFIDRNVRSESSVIIIFPERDDTLETPINFKWECAEQGIIGFELVNNRNKSIVKRTLAERNYLYTDKLNPGLYYWKVFIDNKLKVMGKFYTK